MRRTHAPHNAVAGGTERRSGGNIPADLIVGNEVSSLCY